MNLTNFTDALMRIFRVGESSSTEDDDVIIKVKGIVNNAFEEDDLVPNGTDDVEISRMQSMGVATEGAALDVLGRWVGKWGGGGRVREG